MKTIDIQLGTDPTMYLFKGNTKTRKTTAAASFPGPIYFADCDNRIEVVKKAFPERDDIEYDKFTKVTDMIDKKNEFLRSCPYKTIVFPDTITSFCEMLMNYAIESRGGQSKTSTGKGHKSKGNISLLEIDDYMAETRLMSELMDDLKIINVEQKVNVIVIAHTIDVEIKNLKGEVTGHDQYLISYGKKSAKKIPVSFNEVYHFIQKEGFESGSGSKYICKTASSGLDWAGTALPGVPPEFEWTDKNFYQTLMGFVRKDDKSFVK